MAGTCNDCGASTWGRYRICPECRKERKKQIKICEICNGIIRGSGIKYCSYCKNSKEAKKYSENLITKNNFNNKYLYFENYGDKKFKLNKKNIFKIIPIIFVVLLLLLIISQKKINTSIISPKQNLIDFCINKFSEDGIFDLKKIIYYSNITSVSEQIKVEYKNSYLTPEKNKINIKNIIRKNLLGDIYPIVITKGNKKIDESITENGIYYCNKNGII